MICSVTGMTRMPTQAASRISSSFAQAAVARRHSDGFGGIDISVITTPGDGDHGMGQAVWLAPTSCRAGSDDS
jgi:hypothetical protein